MVSREVITDKNLAEVLLYNKWDDLGGGMYHLNNKIIKIDINEITAVNGNIGKFTFNSKLLNEKILEVLSALDINLLPLEKK